MLTQEQIQELDNLVADMQANQAADDDIQAAVDARKAEMLASLEEVKKEAVVEDEIALATAETVDTELQSENGSLASQYDSSVDINQGGITPENENEVFAPTASGYMAVSNNEEQLEENAAENGAVPVDLWSHGRRNLDETVEEREARQEAELVAWREQTNQDRYIYNKAGEVVLDEITGQPVLKELSSFDKILNSFGNMADQIQQAIPNASFGINSIVRKVFGDELIDSFLANEDIPQFFKDFGTMTAIRVLEEEVYRRKIWMILKD